MEFSMPPIHLIRVHAGAVHLHSLGPRALAEMLAEIAVQTGPAPVLEALADYARLSPAQIHAARRSLR
jgi:hypothetical protein